MRTRQSDGSDGGTGAQTHRRSPARLIGLGAAAALGLAATAVLWYQFAHGEGGYVSWSRREEADAPDTLVVPTLFRSPDTDDIAPPF